MLEQKNNLARLFLLFNKHFTMCSFFCMSQSFLLNCICFSNDSFLKILLSFYWHMSQTFFQLRTKTWKLFLIKKKMDFSRWFQQFWSRWLVAEIHIKHWVTVIFKPAQEMVFPRLLWQILPFQMFLPYKIPHHNKRSQ